jgi:RNA polymerase-binding transcription factor DksA
VKPKARRPAKKAVHKPTRAAERKPAAFTAAVPAGAKIKRNKHFTLRELAFFRDLLLKQRDRIIDGIQFLSSDTLTRSQRESSGDLSSYSVHMADQGTDNFDREFAMSLVSGEQDILYEINEALKRVEQGTYGVCEVSEKPIERERLKILPYARYCVAVQSERERGKPRFRPFARSSIQTAESQIEPS